MSIHRHMARVYLAEARSRYGNPNQRAFVSQLVGWARTRLHEHLTAIKTLPANTQTKLEL